MTISNLDLLLDFLEEVEAPPDSLHLKPQAIAPLSLLNQVCVGCYRAFHEVGLEKHRDSVVSGTFPEHVLSLYVREAISALRDALCKPAQESESILRCPFCPPFSFPLETRFPDWLEVCHGPLGL
jgi:hypothetical protein